MNAKEIREGLSVDQVIQVYQSLGGQEYKFDNNNDLLLTTICHGGDGLKLYYYVKDKTFHCYTGCGDSFDIFELVQRVKGYSFIQATSYVANLFGIKTTRRKGFITNHLINDWDIISKYEKINIDNKKTLQVFDENILNFYSDLYHMSWLQDGITVETMKKYKIKFDVLRNRIIIPHYDINGNLIGIRCRNLNEDEVEAGRKYMPVYIQGDEYRYTLSLNLFGFYQNKEAIQRTKKIMLFEAEKSVMQVDSMFPDNNFTCAVCGSSISNYQRDIILSSGVREVFLAFDKEFKNADSEEANIYAEKLKRLANKFTPFTTVYVLWDDINLLGYKQSPSDKGKEVLLDLMKNKYEVFTKNMED